MKNVKSVRSMGFFYMNDLPPWMASRIASFNLIFFGVHWNRIVPSTVVNAISSSLRYLLLVGSKIDDETIINICQVLEKNDIKLKVLDLSKNSISAPGAKAVADMITSMGSLQSFSVSHNDIFEEDTLVENSLVEDSLVEAFRHNRSLTHIDLSFISGTEFSGIKTICESLMDSKVKGLHLSGNRITSIQPIIRLVHHLKSLTLVR